MGSTPNDFSVIILPSDGGVDSRPFLSDKDKDRTEDAENWHDCSQNLSSDEDFSDLDLLQFVRLEGSDKSGNRIFRVIGKYFPGNKLIPLSDFLLLSTFAVSGLVFRRQKGFKRFQLDG